jgi:hypothetical protein
MPAPALPEAVADEASDDRGLFSSGPLTSIEDLRSEAAESMRSAMIAALQHSGRSPSGPPASGTGAERDERRRRGLSPGGYDDGFAFFHRLLLDAAVLEPDLPDSFVDRVKCDIRETVDRVPLVRWDFLRAAARHRVYVVTVARLGRSNSRSYGFSL